MSKSPLSKLGLALASGVIVAATTFYAVLPSQKNPVKQIAEESVATPLVERTSERKKEKVKKEYIERVVGEEGIREIHTIQRWDKNGLSHPTANLSVKVKPNYSQRNISLEYLVSPEKEIPKLHFERIPFPRLIPWLNDSATSILLIHPEGTGFSLNQRLIIQSKADSQEVKHAIPFEEAKKIKVAMYLGQKAFEKGAEYIGIPAAEAIEIMEKIVSVQSRIEEETLRKSINKDAVITRIPLYILDKIGYSKTGRRIDIQLTKENSREQFSTWLVIPQIGIGNQDYGFGSLERKIYRINFPEEIKEIKEQKIETLSFLDLENQIILSENIFKLTDDGKKTFFSSSKALDILKNKNPEYLIGSKLEKGHSRTISPNDGVPEIMLVLDGGFRRIRQARSRTGDYDYKTRGTLYIIIDNDAIKRLKHPKIEWELDSDDSKSWEYWNGENLFGNRYNQKKLIFKKTQYDGIYAESVEFNELPSINRPAGRDAVIRDYKATPNVKMSFTLWAHCWRENPFHLEKEEDLR
ncbi:MAG: hypothetical protein ABH804_02760 [archaeon]